MDESEEPEKKIGLFDFLNSISQTKRDILSEDTDKQYNQYIINRFLSAESDTLLLTNEVNAIPHISKRMHYDFLRLIIPARRRYFKYLKPEKLEKEELIKKFFGYNTTKSKEIMNILSETDYDYIRKTLDVGGVREKTRIRKSRKGSEGV